MRNISMFKADPKMIKEQIEVLIQGDYMKRDENDRALLIYVPWELYRVLARTKNIQRLCIYLYTLIIAALRKKY